MHVSETIPGWLWAVFAAVVGFSLFFDLFLKGHRDRQTGMPMREAIRWTIFWVSLALCFNGFVWWYFGPGRGMEFLSAYLVEESLSIDNLFVFLMIFKFFRVPEAEQPRVLKWGILGAVGMRLILIFAGVELLKRFHWIFYIFGALLIYTAWKLWQDDGEKVDPEQSPLLSLARRWIPFTKDFHGHHFWVRIKDNWHATPLLAALLVIEASDLIFAMDSIPAVLAISDSTFIVYTSNIFAILGLRALYFVLEGFMDMFRYLKHGLSFILAFIGIKMLISGWVPIPIWASLAVIVGVLSIAVVASLAHRQTPKESV